MIGSSTEDAGRAFDIGEASALLARTPRVLDAWLRGLPPDWLTARESPGTWSPLEVLRHLVHADRVNFLPRARWILERGATTPLPAFERLPAAGADQPLESLLDGFAALRAANLEELAGLPIDRATLARIGEHPLLGPVTLQQLLATWVAHDHDHLMQIARILGRQYRGAVGPWRQSLRVISGLQG